MTKKWFIYGGVLLLLVFLILWASRKRSDEQLTADLQLIIKKIDEAA